MVGFDCCYNCGKRIVGCHANCDDYRDTAERYRTAKRKADEHRDKKLSIDAFSNDSFKHRQRRH